MSIDNHEADAEYALRELRYLREQVRALTAERDEARGLYQQEVLWRRAAEDRATNAEHEADVLRARVAEVEAETDAYRESLMETAHFYMEWALKDGNSPGYNREKAATYGDKANEYRIRAEKAAAECDSAQQRMKALRDALLTVVGTTPEAWNEWENGDGENIGPMLAAALKEEAP